MECGINRALIRSTTQAGKITLTAKAEGLPSATITLETLPVKVSNGLSTYLPQMTLKGNLDKGKTPLTHLTKTQNVIYVLYPPKPEPTMRL